MTDPEDSLYRPEAKQAHARGSTHDELLNLPTEVVHGVHVPELSSDDLSLKIRWQRWRSGALCSSSSGLR